MMNGSYPATQVRLTPHLLPDQAEGGDYLAWIVEDHGAQGLYLSTLQKNRVPPFSDEFAISRTKSYDVVIRINPSPQAPYQWEALWAESGQELTEFDRGTISRRSSKAQSFLEQYIPEGQSPQLHGNSIWQNMVLWDLDGRRIDWNPSVLTGTIIAREPVYAGYWNSWVQIGDQDHYYWYMVTSSADRRSYNSSSPVVDSDKVARTSIRVDAIKDLQGNPLSPQISSYKAWLHYGTGGVQVLSFRGLAPYSLVQTDINNPAGISKISATTTGFSQQPPITFAQVALRLIGHKDDPYTLTLDFEELLPPNTDRNIPQKDTVTKSYRRGDARADNVVTIADALFIAQYLAGIRLIGEDLLSVNAVNSASVRQDNPDGDQMTIADALFIAQMLAGIRNGYYDLSTTGAQAAKAARSRTITTSQNTTVEVGSATLPPGGNAQIPVTVKTISDGLGLGGYDFNVTFNPQVIRVDNVFGGSFASPTRNIDNTAGVVLLNAFQSNMPGPMGDVVVAYLAITAIGGSGSSTPLNMSITTLSNSDGSDIPATDVDGMVTIQ